MSSKTEIMMSNIHTRGMELFYVQLIFLLASGITVLIRAYVRIFMVKKVTLDDYLIFLAMVRLQPEACLPGAS